MGEQPVDGRRIGASRSPLWVRKHAALSTGVAVVADNTWNAIQGRQALDIVWDDGPNAAVTSAGIRATFVTLAGKPVRSPEFFKTNEFVDGLIFTPNAVAKP